MISKDSDWYKKGWTLDIKNLAWVEDTKTQVDFIIKELSLKGNERILDLACGFGRHSLELARRGFSVVGVDITSDYIDDATKQAQQNNLNAKFILSDIRDVCFNEEFDVVLNMADGAVGYLEDDVENLKIFDVIAKSLKKGGKHFMDIMSADYANTHFPCQLWATGDKKLTLSKFEWNKNTKLMIYGQLDIQYGTALQKPTFIKGNPTRLYCMNEIKKIMKEHNMQVKNMYSDFFGNLANENKMQMLVFSYKL